MSRESQGDTLTATNEPPSSGEHEQVERPDPEGIEPEPAVVDWSTPTREEAQRLANEPPERLALLAQLHPQLAVFLQVGLQAIKGVGSEERAASQHAADSYFALTNKTVDGLFKRLDQSGVSEAEAATIYELLDKLQGQSADKTTEFLNVNLKTGSKTMLVAGLLLSAGLSLAFAAYSGQRPSNPPPSIHG
jgi:hypothetical protein